MHTQFRTFISVLTLSGALLLTACDDPAENGVITNGTADPVIVTENPLDESGNPITGDDGPEIDVDGGSTAGEVEQDAVLGISFVSASPDQLVPSGQINKNSSTMTFQVQDLNGGTVEGEEVTFTLLNSTGGTAFEGGTGSGEIVATTGADGRVFVIVNAGTTASTFRVRADLLNGSSAISTEIPISTGVPVANRFSLAFGVLNFVDASRQFGVRNSVSVIVSDQQGNNALDGTVISFRSQESGLVGSSCRIVDGGCSVEWTSAEPRSPTGRITILASTQGAEFYEDSNGNGVYDLGEDFEDLPEVYADENENGQFDTNEDYVDANQNGVYDSVGNGLWDGPCFSESCSGGLQSTTIGASSYFLVPVPSRVLNVVEVDVGTLAEPDVINGNFIGGATFTELDPTRPSTLITGIFTDSTGRNSPPAGAMFTVEIEGQDEAVVTSKIGSGQVGPEVLEFFAPNPAPGESYRVTITAVFSYDKADFNPDEEGTTISWSMVIANPVQT